MKPMTKAQRKERGVPATIVPVDMTHWINVYPKAGYTANWQTRELADANAGDRAECIPAKLWEVWLDGKLLGLAFDVYTATKEQLMKEDL